MKINLNEQYFKLVLKLIKLGWECHITNSSGVLKWKKGPHHLYVYETADGEFIGDFDL